MLCLIASFAASFCSLAALARCPFSYGSNVHPSRAMSELLERSQHAPASESPVVIRVI